MVYQPKPFKIAGFEISGWKLDDGTIRLGSDKDNGTIVLSWPEEVEVSGVTYTLEDEKWQDNGFGWGIYV